MPCRLRSQPFFLAQRASGSEFSEIMAIHPYIWCSTIGYSKHPRKRSQAILRNSIKSDLNQLLTPPQPQKRCFWKPAHRPDVEGGLYELWRCTGRHGSQSLGTADTSSTPKNDMLYCTKEWTTSVVFPSLRKCSKWLAALKLLRQRRGPWWFHRLAYLRVPMDISILYEYVPQNETA